MIKEIYCGDEYTAATVEAALKEVWGEIKTDIITIDGEYFVAVEVEQ